MPAAGRRLCPGADCPWGRLLDDDHLAGVLGRIRAVAHLIGVAAEADPAQVRAAGWLIESLADEAEGRLEDAVRRVAHHGCQARQPPV